MGLLSHKKVSVWWKDPWMRDDVWRPHLGVAWRSWVDMRCDVCPVVSVVFPFSLDTFFGFMLNAFVRNLLYFRGKHGRDASHSNSSSKVNGGL